MGKTDVEAIHSQLKDLLTLEEYVRLFVLMAEQAAKMQERAARMEAKRNDE